MLKQILLQVFLILLNAMFAATEIAFISLNEKKIKSQAEDGDKKAAKMLKIIEEPTKLLSAIQVGITLAGFLGSAFAADNFSERLTGFIVGIFNVGDAYVGVIDGISVIIITLVLSYFTLVLGELVPKRIAMRHKEALAGAVCGFMLGLTKFLYPVIWFLTVSTNLVLRLFRIDPNEKEDSVSEEDIVIMLDAGADEGTIPEDNIEYIKNVFKLDNLTAADIMTPRSSIASIPLDVSESELLRIIEEEGYSRIPVYNEDLDEIIGILQTRTYLLKYKTENFNIKDILLEPEFVPENIHLDVLFKRMQSEHIHMMIVIDEYGSVIGIVTMEDIIEELLGEIWDEEDEAVENITDIGDSKYRVLCGASVDEFFDFFELRKNEEIESSTVNGWLCEALGDIPAVGSIVNYENLIITVTVADEQMAHEAEVLFNERSADDLSE